MGVHRQFSSFLVGEGPLLLSCADLLLSRGHRIRGIICSEALIKRFAAEHGIPWVDPSTDLTGPLSQEPFDYLFSVANLTMLPSAVLKMASCGAINFHDSLLPEYAGIHASSWALIHQASEHGVTWHLMTEDPDSGSILKQRKVPIDPAETTFSLSKKCIEAGVEAFAELIDELAENRVCPKAQDVALRSYFSKFSRPTNAGVLSWKRSASELTALVRALDFGPAPNLLGSAKLKIGYRFYVVSGLEMLSTRSGAKPGTILSIDENSASIATSTHDVRITCLKDLDAEPIDIRSLFSQAGLTAGARLEELTEELQTCANTLIPIVVRNEQYWVERFSSLRPLELPYLEHVNNKPNHESDEVARASGSLPPGYAAMTVTLPASIECVLQSRNDLGDKAEFLLAAFGIFIGRLMEEERFDVGFSDHALRQIVSGMEGLFASSVPLRIEFKTATDFVSVSAAIRTQLEQVRLRRTHLRDLACRYPALNSPGHSPKKKRLPVQVEFGPNGHDLPLGTQLLLRVDGSRCEWIYDTSAVSESSVARMRQQWITFLTAIAAHPTQLIGDLPVLSDNDTQQLLSDWNDTSSQVDGAECKHERFESEAKDHPDRIAVVFEDRQLTYGELNHRANQLAHYLRARGVGPDVLVGLCIKRSIELAVTLLGVMKAGGAYVPLDPEYPQERLALMLEDSGASILLIQQSLLSRLPEHKTQVVCVDSDWPKISREKAENPASSVTPSNLAYVIYTSGSTGKPKGVMVEHRNVVNFFAGMDRVIGAEPPGTWLAVTSVSFDISVLELFWTLTRGFKVIIQSEQQRSQVPDKPKEERRSHKKIGFSLFYFASDQGGVGTDKYRLLLEGARFADRNGFEAVWTPERHFHAFGGLYPNPSVTSAAIAAITERIQIRAGSVVLPLHHPVRVAEEWAVVDNLSKGRVGISFASGWQANDFVLAPDNYSASKQIMLRDIETVRKLWRGESIQCRNGKGDEVEVTILPRPVQSELPIWITAAGNPDTFRIAGELGANLLTHLLGQSIESLAEKIAIYRAAWRENRHQGEGRITLMLHTFVGESMDAVREQVRKPFSDYLRSSVDLIKRAPSAFPTMPKHGASGQTLDQAMTSENFKENDMDALVAHAFDRYFETSALFGTPETCSETVERLKEIGVDEIACLIDFGVETNTALQSLEHLNRVRQWNDENAKAEAAIEQSISAQILQHEVTHFQCTPSMARMLLAENEGPKALAKLEKLFLGGEALPQTLLDQLAEVTSAQIFNMYGPTETTIWSTVAKLGRDSARVHIGRPIANTQIYILDHRLRPVPIGITGELFIGGAGVTRGYWNRPELTAERFVPNPFTSEPGARLYRTGDAVRYLEDGNIEFLGRLDNQVKIRGHRIELQEIEKALELHDAIEQAVVVAREDVPGNKRLVAYLVKRSDAAPAVSAVREFLQKKLPEFMIPEMFIFLAAMPLTPNGKVNRKALPAPDAERPELAESFVAPRTPVEKELAQIWSKELGIQRVGVQDNFFNLGGNSLLAVQIAFCIRQAFQVELPLHTFFDRPTISGLGAILEEKIMEQVDDQKIEELLLEIESLPN